MYTQGHVYGKKKARIHITGVMHKGSNENHDKIQSATHKN